MLFSSKFLLVVVGVLAFGSSADAGIANTKFKACYGEFGDSCRGDNSACQSNKIIYENTGIFDKGCSACSDGCTTCKSSTHSCVSDYVYSGCSGGESISCSSGVAAWFLVLVIMGPIMAIYGCAACCCCQPGQCCNNNGTTNPLCCGMCCNGGGNAAANQPTVQVFANPNQPGNVQQPAPLNVVQGSAVAAPVMAAPAVASPAYAVQAQCVSIGPYTGTDATQLSFAANEQMTIVAEQGPWWTCKKADGSQGLVPSNYVKKM